MSLIHEGVAENHDALNLHLSQDHIEVCALTKTKSAPHLVLHLGDNIRLWVTCLVS